MTPRVGCAANHTVTWERIAPLKRSIETHLGPTVWLREQGINLAAGDTVEVLGSRVTMRGIPVLLAREIKKGETT
jgi:hypothetical protein